MLASPRRHSLVRLCSKEKPPLAGFATVCLDAAATPKEKPPLAGFAAPSVLDGVKKA